MQEEILMETGRAVPSNILTTTTTELSSTRKCWGSHASLKNISGCQRVDTGLDGILLWPSMAFLTFLSRYKSGNNYLAMQLFQTVNLPLVSDSLAAFNSQFFPLQLDISLIANPEIPKGAELQQYEWERHEKYQNCAYLNYSFTNNYEEKHRKNIQAWIVFFVLPYYRITNPDWKMY